METIEDGIIVELKNLFQLACSVFACSKIFTNRQFSCHNLLQSRFTSLQDLVEKFLL